MATVNDKLITLVPLWSGTVGSGGVANGTETTIPLASASGLTEGSIYVITIDRVDSAGTKTLTKREVVIGKVSGDSLIDCLRGQEGTAQAHSAGAVVEVLFTAKQWNRLVEGVDAEHDADTGVHKASLTLTTPVVNGAVTGTITPPNTFYSTLALAEGQMLYGKISATVASNNLTVALKHCDSAGNLSDPSAAKPVYVMIGGVLRSITAALTYTLPAGSASFKAGSAELATKAIDYFAYLVWKASDSSWIIGWSRIPYATVYSDFSATQDDANYLARNATPAAGDVAVLIGRFEATLSAGAGYTWSVPTFTATNLIQRPIYETRWLDWTPTVSWVAGTAPTGAGANYSSRYKVAGDRCFIHYMKTNMTAGATVTRMSLTMPFNLNNPSGGNLSLMSGAVSTDLAAQNTSVAWTVNGGAGNQFIHVACASCSATAGAVAGSYPIG